MCAQELNVDVNTYVSKIEQATDEDRDFIINACLDNSKDLEQAKILFNSL